MRIQWIYRSMFIVLDYTLCVSYPLLCLRRVTLSVVKAMKVKWNRNSRKSSKKTNEQKEKKYCRWGFWTFANKCLLAFGFRFEKGQIRFILGVVFVASKKYCVFFFIDENFIQIENSSTSNSNQGNIKQAQTSLPPPPLPSS